MTPPARPMTLPEWGLLVTLSIVWGGSFFFNALAVAELPTFTVVTARVLLAALALWIFIHATGGRMPRDPRVWAAFLAMGLLNNAIPFSLIVWGQQHVASGAAAILNAATPLFGVVVAAALTRDEPATLSKIAGVLAGVAGVAVMIGVDALANPGVNVLGQLAILCAALAYAFAGVFGRRFRKMGVTPVQTAAGQVTASALFLLPVALLADRPWQGAVPSAAALAAVAGLALLCTAFAYILYFRILATAGAVNLMLVTLLVPVSAILLGIAFLGESLAPRHLFGMAAIAAGLAAIDGRPLRKLRQLLRPGSAPAG